MNNPESGSSRFQRAKENVAFLGALVLIPPTLVGSGILYSRVDIPSSDDALNVNTYKRGKFAQNLFKKGTRDRSMYLDDGATVAGDIVGKKMAVYDMEPDFSHTHDGRAMVRYGGELKKSRRNGRTVITVQSGKTIYVYHGETKEVGDTGVKVSYRRPGEYS